jgi:capsule polysaccharide export protein KpsE/RkpR
LSYSNINNGIIRSKTNCNTKEFPDINTKLGNKIEAIINTENKDLVEKEIDYEEIIDEILEKNEKNISDNNDRYQVKNGLIKLISESKDINLKAFLISKDEYIKKRKPVIEAALRLVKKIVNDENGEYEKFYKEFYG